MRQESIYEVRDSHGERVCSGTARDLSRMFCVEVSSIYADAKHGHVMLSEYTIHKTGEKDIPRKELSDGDKEFIRCVNSGMPSEVLSRRFGITKQGVKSRIYRLKKRGEIL